MPLFVTRFPMISSSFVNSFPLKYKFIVLWLFLDLSSISRLFIVSFFSKFIFDIFELFGLFIELFIVTLSLLVKLDLLSSHVPSISNLLLINVFISLIVKFLLRYKIVFVLFWENIHFIFVDWFNLGLSLFK